jgi:Putative DNA-binding domain
VLSLVEYQRQVAAVLLGEGGRSEAAEAELPMACRPGLEVHRGTIFHALVRALQLTFPTVLQLTGERFFERVASDYVPAHPPLGAVLYDYGAKFPAYLATYSALECYPYLSDVASFDLCIDRVAHFDSTTFGRAIVVAKSCRLRLSASLICLQTNYPVDQIRDSLDAGRPDDLVNLDMVPQPRHFAIWRSHAGASVKPLSPRASVFIQAVLAQSDIGAALKRSTGRSAYGRAAAAIYDEIATNSFALISSVR